MVIERKVVWGEGTLISPQHFQQLERYYDYQLSQYYLAGTTYGWGFQELVLNLAASRTGVLSVERLSGFFKDGSFFNETLDSAPHLTLHIPANIENEYVYLVWSNLSTYQRNYSFIGDREQQLSRFISSHLELNDLTELNLPKRNIVVAAPNLRLALAQDIPEGTLSLPIALVASTTNTGEVFLNENFIPPCINMQVNQRLRDYQSEIMGLLKQRAIALASILTNPSLTSTGDVRDFLMLQTINRYSAYMHHISTILSIHPCQVYESWLKLYGDLSTFKTEKMHMDLPVYHHDQLQASFEHLVRLLRDVLSIVLEQRAILIPLEIRDEATRVAITPDRTLLNSCNFVLAIQASMPSEVLRQRIPATAKIGSVEKIKDLVSYHLPGVRLNALSTAPRELPYHAGYSYFELDKSSELWADLNNSSGMAIHLAGDFPDLQIECWAIKSI
ncbi:type VI secretion system baseplate subunit TssK [Acinetobacter populi]|uniref:Type VI secretion system-associated protein n=1 Tax=Acinetobacter populi TaxID=1582270 RepID=A0A1Z9Z1A1_9GAMM|nr:type VI secretion system baseplate subunit TssK [Acinetobacter populi]OUY08261.1 type VI secretion system-associated protein [Acinetobacter populi]